MNHWYRLIRKNENTVGGYSCRFCEIPSTYLRTHSTIFAVLMGGNYISFCYRKCVADNESRWNHTEFCCRNIFLLLHHCSKIKMIWFCCIIAATFVYVARSQNLLETMWDHLQFFSRASNATHCIAIAWKMFQVALELKAQFLLAFTMPCVIMKVQDQKCKWHHVVLNRFLQLAA